MEQANIFFFFSYLLLRISINSFNVLVLAYQGFTVTIFYSGDRVTHKDRDVIPGVVFS